MELIRSQLTSLQTELDKEIKHLDHQRNEITAQIKSMREEKEKLSVAPHKIEKDRILLDVGGHFFSTTIETLTSIPDSVLGRMFSGRFPIKFTEDGRVFVDRDGTHFRHILNFFENP